jgi:hypothetical protein
MLTQFETREFNPRSQPPDHFNMAILWRMIFSATWYSIELLAHLILGKQCEPD